MPNSPTTRSPLAAATGLALALLLAGCGGAVASRESPASGGAGQPAVRVTAISPSRKTLKRIIELPGRVEAFEVAPLHAKVTGYVDAISVDIGDKVQGPSKDSPGTELCRLLVPELKEELAEKTALVSQAKAEVLQAEAAIKVAEAVVQSANAKIQEAQAAVAREEATYQRWVSEFERITQLAESGAVNRKVLEETRSQLDAASAGKLEITARIAAVQALARESSAGLDKTKADLVATQSRLQVAEAEQRRLEAMVGYAVMRAPFDGVVVERNVHTGHLVRSGGSSSERPLLVVMTTDPVRVFIDVPETDAVYVVPTTPAVIKVPSLAGDPFEAQVTRTSWALNTTSRTLKAEVELPNTAQTLRAGLYVLVELTVAELKDVLSLPRIAIFTQDKQPCCYTIDADNQIVLTPITLGLQAGLDVEIRTGLTGNERVIGANTAAFRPGMKVEIAPVAPVTPKP